MIRVKIYHDEIEVENIHCGCDVNHELERERRGHTKKLNKHFTEYTHYFSCKYYSISIRSDAF
jgi:hypothetical protein